MRKTCVKCKHDCHCDSTLRVIVKGFNNYSKKVTICETCACPDTIKNPKENNNG